MLYFSEPFLAESQRVQLRRTDGQLLELPRSRSVGLVINQPLSPDVRGVFVVSWRVVSDDGHVSLGEFAFAAGSTAAVPKIKTGSQGMPWPDVSADWLMFIGLALALGGLMSELVIWKRQGDRRVPRAPVVPGVIVAFAGGALGLVLLAGSERDGGIAAGLHSQSIDNAIGTRPGALILTTLVVLALAGALACFRSLRAVAVLPLLAAVVVVVDRGHSGTLSTGWAVIAGSLHLAAVAVWLGALTHLVIVARGEQPHSAFVAGAWRYSRLALPTVLLVLATGILTAIPEFRSLSDLYSTGYGRALLIKAGLISVALTIALAARLHALPASPHPRLSLLRRLTTAEATTVLLVLIAAAALANAAPPRTRDQAHAAAVLLGPPPVAGRSIQLADFAGQLIVSLTAGARELQFKVLAPGYQPPGRIRLTAEAHQVDGSASELVLRPCGGACFSADFRLRPGITEITAHATSSRWPGGNTQFAVPSPLGPQHRRVVLRITHTMQALRSITFRQMFMIPYGKPEAPTTHTVTGRQFVRTDLGAGAQDVRSLGTRGGLTGFAFIYPSPGAPLWYRIWVDARSRLRRELIVGEQGRIYRSFR